MWMGEVRTGSLGAVAVCRSDLGVGQLLLVTSITTVSQTSKTRQFVAPVGDVTLPWKVDILLP
jgi:hypothetical protein